MKLTLQYTNSRDKKNIKEAAKLKDRIEAKGKGWTHIGSGAYKDVYKKGNIVVKFNRGPHETNILNEVNFYKKADNNDKKYLARVFGGDENKMIQRFVKGINRTYTYKERNEICKIATKMGLSHDIQMRVNIVITKKKKIIFRDFGGHMM